MGFDIIKKQQSGRDVPAPVSQRVFPYYSFQEPIMLSLEEVMFLTSPCDLEVAVLMTSC